MTLAPGDAVGPYEILAPLGAGGMGEVYRARDPRLGREVAVKVLPEELSHDPERLRRFDREARAAAALSHPNILDVHDTGVEGGVPYIVSELLEGETLRERLSRAALPTRKTLDYAVQIAQGLGAAHEKSIVHRDLKPENLFVTRDGRMKILDFGLAKLRGPRARGRETVSEGDTVSQSSQGMVLGTASYMSPEQVRGEPADARSDIFSFGAVLYEMLSGERAFRGPTAVESMSAILNEDPAAVSSLKPGLPPALVQIVSRCLEKQPDERFHSAHDLGLALETVSGAPKEGRETLPPPPRARLPGRRGWIALAAVIALLLLALPLGFNLGDLRDRSRGDTPAGSIESIAVLPLENLSGDPEQEYFSDGMTDVLISELGKVQALRVISRQSVMQFKGSERPVPEIARMLGVDAVVEGSVQRSGDRARTIIRLLRTQPEQLLWTESYDRDLGDVLQLQGDLAREIATAVQVTVTPEERARLTARRPANPEAHDAYFKGLYFLGRDLTVDRAVRYFEQALQADPEYAPAYARLASCYTHLANLGSRDPEPAFARAEAAALRALELDESLPEPHIILASIRFNRDWDWAEAEREVNRALRLNPSDASAHFRRGEHLVVMGQFEEGIAALRRAQALAPLKPATHTRVAMLLHFARRYDESIRESQRALELDPDYYWANAVLGVTYGQIGRHEEAIAYLRKACAVTADDRVKVSLKAALGRAYALSGHRGQAEEILREVRDKAEYAWSIDLAGLLAAVGETDEALDVLEDAFERRVGTITWINVEPKVDPLRDEPRFQALVRRLNFPEV